MKLRKHIPFAVTLGFCGAALMIDRAQLGPASASADPTGLEANLRASAEAGPFDWLTDDGSREVAERLATMAASDESPDVLTVAWVECPPPGPIEPATFDTTGYRLEATLAGATPLAIVNGKRVGVGDAVGELEILAIDGRAVHCAGPDGAVTLSLAR